MPLTHGSVKQRRPRRLLGAMVVTGLPVLRGLDNERKSTARAVVQTQFYRRRFAGITAHGLGHAVV